MLGFWPFAFALVLPWLMAFIPESVASPILKTVLSQPLSISVFLMIWFALSEISWNKKNIALYLFMPCVWWAGCDVSVIAHGICAQLLGLLFWYGMSLKRQPVLLTSVMGLDLFCSFYIPLFAGIENVFSFSPLSLVWKTWDVGNFVLPVLLGLGLVTMSWWLRSRAEKQAQVDEGSLA